MTEFEDNNIEKKEDVSIDSPSMIIDGSHENAEQENVVEEITTESIQTKSKPLKKKRSKFPIGKGLKKVIKWLGRRLANIFAIRRIDRFILKKFLGTYFMATVLMLAVISMFDVTEKLDAFLTAPFSETLFDYFMSFLPYFALMLSPLFVFISVIFFTTKLAGNSEIIAILSSGISFRRLLRPYMIGAAIIAALTFVMSNYLIPPTNQRRINYTNKYVKNKSVTTGIDIQLMASPGVVCYIGRFENDTKTGYRFSLDKFNGKQLVSRMTAQTALYDTTKMYHWTVRDYMIRDFDGRKEKIKSGNKLDTIIPIEPRDFLISVNDQETLTTPQITEYVEKQKMRGVANIKGFEIEREKRYASTAAAFILTLIGMSLSSKKSKGGMGLNIGIGLALSFSYILFSTITSSFAINGLTSPFIAMQIPNVVYLIIGIFLYRRASKF